MPWGSAWFAFHHLFVNRVWIQLQWNILNKITRMLRTWRFTSICLRQFSDQGRKAVKIYFLWWERCIFRPVADIAWLCLGCPIWWAAGLTDSLVQWSDGSSWGRGTSTGEVGSRTESFSFWLGEIEVHQRRRIDPNASWPWSRVVPSWVVPRPWLGREGAESRRCRSSLARVEWQNVETMWMTIALFLYWAARQHFLPLRQKAREDLLATPWLQSWEEAWSGWHWHRRSRHCRRGGYGWHCWHGWSRHWPGARHTPRWWPPRRDPAREDCWQRSWQCFRDDRRGGDRCLDWWEDKCREVSSWRYLWSSLEKRTS